MWFFTSKSNSKKWMNNPYLQVYLILNKSLIILDEWFFTWVGIEELIAFNK